MVENRPYLQQIKTQIFEDFFAQFQLRTYKQGEMLIRADDDPQGIFCVNQGFVRQSIISDLGMELTLNILQPISYFPMIWAINSTPNIYNYEALTQIEVGRAPKQQVLEFIKDKPALILDLMSELLKRYTESLTRIEHLVFSDAYRRVTSVLLYLAQHFGEKNGDKIIVHHRFTHQDIASLVGVARETVSIELAKLAKSGLVEFVDHAMVFRDLKKLKQALSLVAPADHA